MKGKVYFVGAGPGDKGLITVKGVECLEKSDIVIYDELINPGILDYAGFSAKKISVKSLGKLHTKAYLARQQRINKLLTKLAHAGKTVCRLKNGDPFLFARGGEEAAYLAARNVDYEIIPGISAAFGAAGCSEIPLTDRRFASTLCLVTGHEDLAKTDSNIDFDALSKINTVVFYMGVKSLDVIVKKLVSCGKPANTPAALVENATLPGQRVVIASLNNIVRIAKTQRVRPPAIFIVGDVVSLRTGLSWFEKRPLFNKKIVVTRSQKQAGQFTKILEDFGASVVEFPVIRIIPLNNARVTRAIKEAACYDWLIFTSVNGVKIFMQKISDVRNLAGVKIAVIGKMTAQRLKDFNIHADLIPKEYYAESLVEKFKTQNLKGKKILLFRAKQARDILPRALKNMGARVTEIAAYKTVPVKHNITELKQQLADKAIDCLTFTSSSCANNFIALFKKQEKNRLLKNVKVAAIGPITRNTLKTFGVKTQIMPRVYTVLDLAKAIAGYFKK